MSLPTKSQLVSEIQTDPASLGYAGKTLVQDLALLNAQTFTRQGAIAMGAVLGWLASNSLLTAIKAASGDNAAAFLLALNQPTLDVTITGMDTLVTALATAGTISAAQKTALYALGSIPTSRAEILWGVGTVIDRDTIYGFFNQRP